MFNYQNINKFVYTYIQIYVCTYVQTDACIHMHACKHRGIYVYTYIHSYKYASHRDVLFARTLIYGYTYEIIHRCTQIDV